MDPGHGSCLEASAITAQQSDTSAGLWEMVLKWPGRWGTERDKGWSHSPWGALGQKHFTLSKAH